MTNPFKNNRWYQLLSNKYVLVLLFFSVWMIFLDNYSYFNHRFLNQQLKELHENEAYYQNEIVKDKEQIKQLQNDDQTEHYAREKYYMKKDSEDIYIIDFDEDSLKEQK